MAQVLTEGRQSVSGSRSGSIAKIINVLLWILQIGAAGMFLMVGFLKLSAIRNWSGYLMPSESGSGFDI